MLGITAGTHRLWSHRAYKANWPLRVILMLLHTMAFQVDDYPDIPDNCEKII
jgi:stearoyl-CoA desaturase (delta-9 desaturase)